MTKCISCANELPEIFCLRGGECNAEQVGEIEVAGNDYSDEPEVEKELSDPISTGRKRAARLYKIGPGQVCDWAWKKNAGGGVEPIYGCTGRPAVHIHHGPDKSTLNNDRETNISIVCNFCHNRWHVANDRYYVEPRPKDNSAWLPTLQGSDLVIHKLTDIEKASKTEIMMREMSIPEGGKDK